MPSLLFTKGPRKGERYQLGAGEISLGRGADCDLLIDGDEQVSNQHAQLRLADGHWWVIDLASSNGTRVNGQAVDTTALHPGDYVSIGGSALQFLEEDGGEPLPMPAAPSGASVAHAPVAPVLGDDAGLVAELKASYGEMRSELGRVIVGQGEVIEQMLIAVFCRGHALLVGVPGLAKTLLVSSLSEVLDLSFKRIQFTPDLMPSDITGTEVLEQDQSSGARSFRFVRGPLFANMVLADEINRTPPKTQAALLEAMQEHSITAGDQTYPLPEPFFVLATQNPIEQEGTYPLPEAQLDRFMFSISVGYPEASEEEEIIRRVTGGELGGLSKRLDGERVLRLQELVHRVPVADHVIAFAAALARVSRPGEEGAPDFVREYVDWGAGPRAGIFLIAAAKARAILQGRFHATTADVKAVALPVLRHRVIPTFAAEAAGLGSDEIVAKLLEHVDRATRVRD